MYHLWSIEINVRVGNFVLHPNFVLTGEGVDVCSSVAARNLQISSLHPGSEVPPASLPHLPTTPEIEDSLFSQITSGDLGLSGLPPVLNPHKVVLTVDRQTREVLCE